MERIKNIGDTSMKKKQQRSMVKSTRTQQSNSQSKSGSELDSMESRNIAKQTLEINALKAQQDIDNDSINRDDKMIPEINFHPSENESMNSSTSSLTMDQIFPADFEEDLSNTNSLPNNAKKVIIESTSMKAIISKDISIKEKKEQLKKASDHDIRQFIAAKKRELALLLEAQEETDQANPPNSPNPNNEANDEDSTSTKATGNKIE